MDREPKERIILALDVATRADAERLLDRLGTDLVWCKVGLQLFTAEGPAILAMLRERGHRIFLDLKFHDIPNTVRGAVTSSVGLGVDMATIHLGGGVEMARAAVAGAGGSSCLLLGVTVLTSMDDVALAESGIGRSAREQDLHLAAVAEVGGLPGLVASPHEIVPLRERFGQRFRLVIPGVRPSWAETGDQKRIMSPGEAIRAGADWLVIGRPIAAASDPRAALSRILDEIVAS